MCLIVEVMDPALFSKQECSCMASETFTRMYWLKKEALYFWRSRDFLSFHWNLTTFDRSELFDAMLKTCGDLKLPRRCFHLAVHLLDKFISSSVNIDPSAFRLIGSSCLFLACKHEETGTIKASDISARLGNVEKYEMDVVTLNDWRFVVWTAFDWLCFYLHTIDSAVDENSFFIMSSLLDLVTMDVKFLNYPYSVIAASCIHLVLTSACFNLPCDEKVSSCFSWMIPYYLVLIDKNLKTRSGSNKTLYKCSIFHKVNFVQYYIGYLEIFKNKKLMYPYYLIQYCLII